MKKILSTVFGLTLLLTPLFMAPTVESGIWMIHPKKEASVSARG